MFHIIRLILFFLLTTSGAQSWGIGSISSEMYGYDAEKHSVIGGIIEPNSQTFLYDTRRKLSGHVGILGTSTTDENHQVGVIIASLGDFVATKRGQKLLPAPKTRGRPNTAPQNGTIFVDSKGNAIPTPPGGRITGSPDG